MGVNIKKIKAYLEKELSKKWANLDFECEYEKDSVTFAASLTLNNHDDDIRAIIEAYEGGGSLFRAVFDKIDLTEDVLRLLNEFNADDPFFKAYVREDGFLELRHFFVCYDESMFKSYASEFLIRLADMADNEILQALTENTYVEE